jgi:hypothetical protein
MRAWLARLAIDCKATLTPAQWLSGGSGEATGLEAWLLKLGWGGEGDSEKAT